MSVAENEANLERARQAWNSGDLPRYLDLYADGIKLHGYGPEAFDKQAARAFYEGIFAAFDGPQLTFHEVFSSGERLCIRFTMTGTHNGEFMGVPPTGTEIALDGITVLHFADGRCFERWSSADFLGLLIQIGAVPPPGAGS